MSDCEVYVLCSSRTLELAMHFPAMFGVPLSPMSDEYGFPELSDAQEETFHDWRELIQQLVRRPNEPYGIYWHVENGSGDQAMLFFTEDGAMIAGIATTPNNMDDAMVALAAAVGGRYGYVTTENRPPDTVAEFVAICERGTISRLVDGRFYRES